MWFWGLSRAEDRHPWLGGLGSISEAGGYEPAVVTLEGVRDPAQPVEPRKAQAPSPSRALWQSRPVPSRTRGPQWAYD